MELHTHTQMRVRASQPGGPALHLIFFDFFFFILHSFVLFLYARQQRIGETTGDLSSIGGGEACTFCTGQSKSEREVPIYNVFFLRKRKFSHNKKTGFHS